MQMIISPKQFVSEKDKCPLSTQIPRNADDASPRYFYHGPYRRSGNLLLSFDAPRCQHNTAVRRQSKKQRRRTQTRNVYMRKHMLRSCEITFSEITPVNRNRLGWTFTARRRSCSTLPCKLLAKNRILRTCLVSYCEDDFLHNALCFTRAVNGLRKQISAWWTKFLNFICKLLYKDIQWTVLNFMYYFYYCMYMYRPSCVDHVSF